MAAPSSLGCQGSSHSELGDTELKVRPGLLVAHALGGIDGMSYTNSLEALRCNYRRGFRWFEVDLTLTQDGELVAFHSSHEQYANLDRPMHEVPFAEVQRTRYRKKYAIVRLSDVFREARSLGDVVLVTDTKSWSPQMLEAVERVVKEAPKDKSRPRIVLQAYGEKSIEAVAHLAQKIDARVILTLYRTRDTDRAVADMAKRHGVIAVVANQQRFTPWLAERLHAAHVPVLVHTINEHEQMVELTRAGADGFYTDTYVPYERMTTERQTLLDCGAAQPSKGQLRPWLQRDLMHANDYRLSACAERLDGRVTLGACGAEPAIRGPFLPVPPNGQVHVELEVEAPPQGSDFWFQFATKDAANRLGREELHLEPGERRTFSWDISLPNGSPGIETRVGLSSNDARLMILRLAATLDPVPVSAPPADPPAPRG